MWNTAPIQTGVVNESKNNKNGLYWYVCCCCQYVIFPMSASVNMQHANRSNWKCVDDCVFFFTRQFVVFRSFRGGYLPGNHPYPGLLRVLYKCKPTRTRSVCGLCTAFIPVPELSIFVLSVGHTQHHTRSIYPGYYLRTSVSYVVHSCPYPELL